MHPDSNISPLNTACFSGHRIIKSIDDKTMSLFSHSLPLPGTALDALIFSKLTSVLTELCERGIRNYFCGMARGFDLQAGKAVITLARVVPGIRLLTAIPHRRQSDFYRKEEKELYEDILSAATHTVLISEKYRKDCFHMRNDYMVARSSRLICWYDGSPGGTAYTVRKAFSQGLEVINLYDMLVRDLISSECGDNNR